MYNAFVNLGFGFKVNSKLSTTGVFSVQNHNIQLKRGQSSYLLHELGHFVTALKGREIRLLNLRRFIIQRRMRMLVTTKHM